MTETETKNTKTENNTTAEFRQRIGKTEYIVSLHFADGKKENLEDKILRLARNERFSYNDGTGIDESMNHEKSQGKVE